MNRIIEGILSNLIGSWRTTLLGAIAGAALLIPELRALLDGDLATEAVLSNITAALGMMGVGVFARDNNKSSEDVGATPPGRSYK